MIIGSSRRGTGLQFVDCADAEVRRVGGEEALNAFATPKIVHFCAVFLLAAILTTPHQTVNTLTICLLGVGLGGVTYATIVTLRARRVRAYKPVLEDWIWHSLLPIPYAWLSSPAVRSRAPEEAL